MTRLANDVATSAKVSLRIYVEIEGEKVEIYRTASPGSEERKP